MYTAVKAAAITIDDAEDLSESSLSRVASKFRVVLFGIGKTVYAPPDQPALQVLLQYRNLYELAIRDLQARVARNESIPEDVHQRATSLLDKMWRIIIECMREFNKATSAKARLLSAEKMAIMRIAPPAYTVPNPGYTPPPIPHAAKTSSITKPVDHDLVILDPADPEIN